MNTEMCRNKVMNRGGVAALVMLVCLALPLVAFAQDSESDDLGVSISVMGGGVSSADVDNREGSVSILSGGFSVECPVATVSYMANDYDWSDKDKLPFGNGLDDPWDVLHSLGIALDHFDMVTEQWGYFVGGAVSADWEKEMDDSYSAMLNGGAIYAFNEETSVSFGAAAGLHKLGASLFPVLNVSYRQASQQGFSALVGVPASWLRYRFTDAWLLKLGASMSGGTYRLEDESTVERKGYIESSGITAGLIADWNPCESVQISFGPDFHFAREFTVYDKDGDKKNSYDVDSAWGASATVTYSF